MPRKPANELENTEKKSKSKAKEATLKKAESTAKTKTSTAKKTSATKSSAKTSTEAKKATKSTSKSKAPSTKKATKTGTKKATTKKSTTRKSTTTRAKKSSKVVDADSITSTTDLTHKIEILEYYDLPYRYNQTVVKVLAQTPTTLFIYWDISDNDRANFVKQYGEDFFNYTKPVLVIHNKTMHYSFEIEIDDFANSWYLHVNDSNCEYTVELGRRPKYYNE